jgi:anti-anti-sigma regulatory factor
LSDSGPTETWRSRKAAEISLSRFGESSVLRLAGAIDIDSAAELRAALLEALKGSREIQISTDGVSEADVTALQLLWAARRAAGEAGVDFSLSRAPAIGSLAAELGMEETFV